MGRSGYEDRTRYVDALRHNALEATSEDERRRRRPLIELVAGPDGALVRFAKPPVRDA